MPTRLRPTAPTASDAVLVGDPGRALLLAQELLEQPKMSNHARGLWGYFGTTPRGVELTIQATGIGGPSAALILDDLAELGVQRAVRVGSCVGLGQGARLGALLLVREAVAEGGSVAALGINRGARVKPDPQLTQRLAEELGAGCSDAVVASVDAHPRELSASPEVAAADMQTAPLLRRAEMRQIKAAAVLILAEDGHGDHLEKQQLEQLEKQAGRAASAVLSA
jgi:uridine phosphorylase